MQKTYQTKWNLSELYSGVESIDLQKDFLKLENKVENFKKTYSIIFHTFHTENNFSLFYKEYEDIVKIFQKIQYFLIFSHTIDVYNEEIVEKLQKCEKISADIMSFLDILYQKCNDDFVKNLEILHKKPLLRPYRNIIKHWIQDYYRQKNISQKEKNLIQENEKSIAEYQFSYDKLLQEYYNQRIDSEIFHKRAQEILYLYFKARLQNAQLQGFGSIWKQQSEIYQIDTETIEIIFEVLKENNDLLLQEVQQIQENNFDDTISVEVMIVTVMESLQEYFPQGKNIIENLFSSGNIDLFPNKNKKQSVFTSCFYGGKPYISLQFKGKRSDIISCIHESGHAYQCNASQKNYLGEYESSPFLGEMAAIFFENVLLNYYKKYKYEKYNYSYLQESQKSIQETLINSWKIVGIEKDIYEAIEYGTLKDSDEFGKFLENYEDRGYSKREILLQFQFFYSPFYMASYIFGTLLSVYVFHFCSREDFVKLCHSSSSCDMYDLFQTIGIDIHDKTIYQKALEKLF